VRRPFDIFSIEANYNVVLNQRATQVRPGSVRAQRSDIPLMPEVKGEASMSPQSLLNLLVALFLTLCATAAFAQMTIPYGLAISLENAKKVAGPALAEARKNNWTMAVAIVDPAGNLVYFEKMDGTQAASAAIAVGKARSAAQFKRPTKALQDALAAGGEGLRILGLEGAVPVEGGIPLVEDGKIVGAIGVSGGTSQQDSQCAAAGAALLR
jgi:uncharacterized protein GlcG (DUF336 family)